MTPCSQVHLLARCCWHQSQRFFFAVLSAAGDRATRWHNRLLMSDAYVFESLAAPIVSCPFDGRKAKELGHTSIFVQPTQSDGISNRKKKLSVSPVSSKIRLIDVRAPDRWPFRISCSSFACVMFPPFSRMNGLAKEGGKRSGRSSHLHRRLFESTSRSLRLIWLANEYQFLSIW